jgi:hypothetical protein
VRLTLVHRPAAVVDARLGAAAAAAVLSGAIGWVVVERPDLLRLAIAVGFVAMVLAIAARRPGVAVLVTLVALPFEALVRRLLIGETGLPANDPLILIGPVVAIALCWWLFVVRRRPLATDVLSKLMLGFLALSLLGVVNPAGSGVTAELGGLLFLAAPLLWFFVGRELGDPSLARRLLLLTVAIGAVVAVYGLWQTQVALPPWDRTWVELNGYESLNVGRSLRPFSTFSSNAEYALWLAGALGIAVAGALHGRGAMALAVPLLATALALASVRSALLLAVLAVTVAIGLRSRRLPVAAAVVVLGLGAAYAGVRVYGAAAGQAAAASGNDLLSRQVGGITNPLDPRQSTLLLHLQLVTDGVRSGLSSPLGHGPGSTNLAGARFGGDASRGSTEVDVSNAFVSLGLLGGVTFIGILILSFRGIVRRYLAGETLALSVLALLLTCLGQWLTGGLYALMPLFWFQLGWASAPPSPEESP